MLKTILCREARWAKFRCQQFTEGYRTGVLLFARLLNTQAGGISIKALIGGILLLYVGAVFIIQFTPTIETDVTSANITQPITMRIVNILVWALPVGALVGVLFGAFKFLGGSKKGM